MSSASPWICLWDDWSTQTQSHWQLLMMGCWWPWGRRVGPPSLWPVICFDVNCGNFRHDKQQLSSWLEAWQSSLPEMQRLALSCQRQGWNTQEYLLVVHCFCMHGGSALRFLGVSMSVECEVLSLLSYPKFLLSVFSCIIWAILIVLAIFIFCCTISQLFSFSCQQFPSDWLERLHWWNLSSSVSKLSSLSDWDWLKNVLYVLFEYV